MLELTKEQKIQIINGRRQIVARNIFELEVDLVVMYSEGRNEQIPVLNQRIEELKETDRALQDFMDTL